MYVCVCVRSSLFLNNTWRRRKIKFHGVGPFQIVSLITLRVHRGIFNKYFLYSIKIKYIKYQLKQK